MRMLMNDLSPKLRSKLAKRKVLKSRRRFANVLLDNIIYEQDIKAVSRHARLSPTHLFNLSNLAELNSLSNARFKECIFFTGIAVASYWLYNHFSYLHFAKPASYIFGGMSFLSALAHTILTSEIRSIKKRILHVISASLNPIFSDHQDP